MTNTSLISSATTEAQTEETASTEVKTPAATEQGEDNPAEKIYDSEQTEDKPKSEESEDVSKTEDTDEKPKSEEGEDASKGEDKEDDAKTKEDKVEAFDLSDVEFDLPEGMELNEEVLGDLGTLAADLGVKSKEDAAKFIPLGVKLVENAMIKQQEQFAETRSEWRDNVQSDKEIGWSDDKGRAEKLAIADRGLTAIGSPELRTLLDQTGLGDNPEVIRAFYKAGLAASEDVVETGGSGTTAAGGLDAMYPTMAGKK